MSDECLKLNQVNIGYRVPKKSQIVSLFSNPRLSMTCFPLFFQTFITRITGKPLPKEKYKFKSLSPWHHLITSFFTLIAGILGSILLVREGQLFMLLLPVTWVFTVHGARKSRTLIMHQCAHNNFISKNWFDWLLGKFLSIILITEEFTKYKKSHIENHSSRAHQTILDPVVACLFHIIGLKPGMKVIYLWKQLFIKIFGPTYHLRFFLARFSSHLIETSLFHKIFFLSYLAGLIALILTFDLYWEFLFAIIIPLGVLYQISCTVRVASKYIFPQKPLLSAVSVSRLIKFGIFTGTNCPAPYLPFSKSLFTWLKWGLEMFFFHIPLRLFILPGTCCVQDYQDRYYREPDWANYIYNRQADIPFAKACNLPYREVWGLYNAIDECFKSLSYADPKYYMSVNELHSKACILIAEN